MFPSICFRSFVPRFGLCRLRSIGSTEHISLTGRETLPPKDLPPLVKGPSWARSVPARSRHVLKARLGGTSWHRRSACWPEGYSDPHCHSALGVQFRVGGTATRARAYRFGTFDVKWQCGWRCPVRSPPSGSVGGTATRAWAYRLGTLDVEWQCEWHCHSAMSVPFALPLALERSDAVRSVPLGSEYYTATRP